MKIESQPNSGSDELSNTEQKFFNREELIYNVTEDLLVIMEDLGISKKELAKRLGKSKSYVTQILSGSRNMTLRSLSDLCTELGTKAKVSFDNHNLKVDEYRGFNQEWKMYSSIETPVRRQKPANEHLYQKKVINVNVHPLHPETLTYRVG